MRTTIHRGHMNIEFHEDGSLHIVHEQQGVALILSKTEWAYLTAVADLHGWSLISMADQRTIISDASGH